MFETYRREVDALPHVAFAPIRRIGGERGWYAFDRLWALRGRIDEWLGGVGARRGRPDPEWPSVGDPIDGWRVEAFEPDRRLRLLAETRLPGRAWLEFTVEPSPPGAVLSQTVTFEPSGLLGQLYWYAVLPLHQAVFRGMFAGIHSAVRAERSNEAQRGGSRDELSRRSKHSPGDSRQREEVAPSVGPRPRPRPRSIC